MAGVETYAQAVGLGDTGDDLGELLESPADVGPLTGGRFEEAPGGQIGRLAVDPRPTPV